MRGATLLGCPTAPSPDIVEALGTVDGPPLSASCLLLQLSSPTSSGTSSSSLPVGVSSFEQVSDRDGDGLSGRRSLLWAGGGRSLLLAGHVPGDSRGRDCSSADSSTSEHEGVAMLPGGGCDNPADTCFKNVSSGRLCLEYTLARFMFSFSFRA